MCDLSDALNAASDNGALNADKKRKRCTEGDAEGDQKNGKKHDEGEFARGGQEEEVDGSNGDDGTIGDDGAEDISETQTLPSEIWGAHAATLIDAATAATGWNEIPSTPFQHQLLRVAEAAGVKSEETGDGRREEGSEERGTDQLLASSREEPLLLQRYAVYSTRQNETPVRVAKTLGLPLVDVLRWNQKK
jgi:hypothetical protein